MLAIVIPLSLIAAFFYALSDFLEQRAARRSAEDELDETGQGASHRLAAAGRSAAGTLRRLTHDRLWLAGWVVGTGAYFLQAVALHLGSVSVVQALQVTSLLFTLPLSTLGRPERPHARDWFGGGCIVAGLILFLASRGATHGVDSVHRDRFLFILLMLLAAVVWLTVVAGLRSGPLRATLLACAAGASFAASASLVKITSDDLTSRGVGATATDWPGYALAVVSVLGVLLQQVAFASGLLPVAATAMIVTNPVVGTAIAIVAFAELLPGDPVRLAGLGFGAALVVTGVTVLSHSPLLTGRAPPARQRPGPAVRSAAR
jgi:drug/metabolite transporter (DMT)-like permease